MSSYLLLALFLMVPFMLHYGLKVSLSSIQGAWKSYLGWEALPTLHLLLCFGLIAIINWDYERKLIFPATASDFADSYLGPILLTIAIGKALLASGALFLLRLLWPKLIGPGSKWQAWLLGGPLWLGVIILLVGSVSIIVLGPAAMTMFKQMHQFQR